MSASNQEQFGPEVLAYLRSRLPDYLAGIGVELKPAGNRLVGACPMHEDRSPSFAVFGEQKELCGCYPCAFTGNVFQFAIVSGRASGFPEAVRHVAAVLGVPLRDADNGSAPAIAHKPRPKAVEPPFKLSAADRQKVIAARVAFSDAADAGELEPFTAELGIPLEAMRWCARGTSGLGIRGGNLCYIYPEGLKVRPPAGSKSRFRWDCGKATAPWRAEWIKPETETVYLTEGESDCMALVAAGLEEGGTAACVASPGTSFESKWAPLFRGKRVVLIFDTDQPGRAATATVAAMLKGNAAEVLTWKGPGQ